MTTLKGMVSAFISTRRLRNLSPNTITFYSQHLNKFLEFLESNYPDLDRKIISLGFGYEGPLFSIWKTSASLSELSLDLFAQYVMTEAQTSTIPGYEFTFDNDHLVIGLGLGFNF